MIERGSKQQSLYYEGNTDEDSISILEHVSRKKNASEQYL